MSGGNGLGTRNLAFSKEDDAIVVTDMTFVVVDDSLRQTDTATPSLEILSIVHGLTSGTATSEHSTTSDEQTTDSSTNYSSSSSSSSPSIVSLSHAIDKRQHSTRDKQKTLDAAPTTTASNSNSGSQQSECRVKCLLSLIVLFVILTFSGALAGLLVIFFVQQQHQHLQRPLQNMTATTAAANAVLSGDEKYIEMMNDSSFGISLNASLFSTKPTSIDQIPAFPNDVPIECGIQAFKPNMQQMRIFGGYRALPKSWPWTVSIAYLGSKASLPHACGGSLVNKRFVITATHCVIEKSIYSLVGYPVKGSANYASLIQMIRVHVGVTTRSTDIHANDTYRVLRIISYPFAKYPDFDERTFQNDLTILELDGEVKETDSTGYICLTRESNIVPGSDLYAVGWGFTNTNFYKASDSLMQVKFQVQSVDECGLSYVPVFQFCGGNKLLNKDTCNGDSGGPIMQFINDRWHLVGIVSNGDSSCSGRGIYTNIAYYLDWINSIIF